MYSRLPQLYRRLRGHWWLSGCRGSVAESIGSPTRRPWFASQQWSFLTSNVILSEPMIWVFSFSLSFCVSLCRSVHLPGNGHVHMSTLQKSENLYDIQSTESPEDLTISNPYVQMPSPTTAPQKEKTFTFSAPQTLSEQSSPDPVFDDPAYSAGYKPPPPPKRKTPR